MGFQEIKGIKLILKVFLIIPIFILFIFQTLFKRIKNTKLQLKIYDYMIKLWSEIYFIYEYRICITK